jgi:hypothetical protein
MTRERRGGLPKSSGETKIGRTQKETDLGETNVGSGEQSKQPPMALFVGLGLVIITTLGGSYFLINAPSIELICRQMGNCQKFKEDSNKAQESLNKAEKSFKSKNSLPELLAASKSIDEAKTILSAIPDNAKDLVTPIAEQRTKIAELDKKQLESKMYSDYEDQFQWFLGAALLFLVFESFLSERISKLWKKLHLFYHAEA